MCPFTLIGIILAVLGLGGGGLNLQALIDALVGGGNV